MSTSRLVQQRIKTLATPTIASRHQRPFCARMCGQGVGNMASDESAVGQQVFALFATLVTPALLSQWKVQDSGMSLCCFGWNQ